MNKTAIETLLDEIPILTGNRKHWYRYLSPVLEKLPREVIECIHTRAMFLFVPFRGHVISPEDMMKAEGRALIVIRLSFAASQDWSGVEQEDLDTIAHEIAHLYLWHDRIQEGYSRKHKREADKIIAKWGFNECYTEAELLIHSDEQDKT